MKWAPVTEASARAVAAGLRHFDAREALNIYEWSPEEAVERSLANSTVRRCICAYDGEPLAVCGVTNQGVIWLLATEGLLATPVRRRLFLREGKQWIDGLVASQLWPVLENWVMASNWDTLRWLRWMGFSVGGASGLWDAPVLVQHVWRKARW
ncbi:MAG: hypothetical protein FJ083_11135 [Cyanobacteria bacterium K_Offshore_surface_m2_239]|nr:hypothetical protein [Cyanobacteria bacterium K_Offshore_surface_m2_239]